MTNVRAIAKLAGVSITTVSRVLNNHQHVSDDARERVLSASQKLSYNQSVGRRSSNNIAYVYTGDPSPCSPFDIEILKGLQLGLQDTHHDLVIIEAERSRLPNETYAQMFLRKGISGAILRTTERSHAECERVAAEDFPLLVVADHFDNPKVNFIYCDAREACRDAVEYLVGMGHRSIAFCMNVVDDTDKLDRLASYRNTLSELGIPFDERLVMRVPASRDGGIHLMRRLAAMPTRPTALFLADPFPAVGVLSEARRLGVAIPGDLSVLGFDDSDLRLTVVPQLTAVCQDTVALAREALAALLSIMQDPGKDRPRIQKALRCTLEIHETTAAPAALSGCSPAGIGSP